MKKQYVLSLLEKLSEILKKHENVKIYIQNSACYAATKLRTQENYVCCAKNKFIIQRPCDEEINNLEDAIKSYFKQCGNNRVFYTKSAVSDKPVDYDQVIDKHFAEDENETKFDYYHLENGELTKYKGTHDEAKQQKNADLHGNKVIDKTVNNNLEIKNKYKKNSII